jgi:hypothetical protein
MLIRTIPLTGTLKQIIPPDQQQHTGRFQWTVVLPADTTLADDANGDNEVELAAASTLVLVAENESLWASGSGNVQVIGCTYPD